LSSVDITTTNSTYSYDYNMEARYQLFEFDSNNITYYYVKLPI